MKCSAPPPVPLKHLLSIPLSASIARWLPDRDDGTAVPPFDSGGL
jgi:hypothetical protein